MAKLEPYQQTIKTAIEDGSKVVLSTARQMGKSDLNWKHIQDLLVNVLHKNMSQLIIDTGTVFGEEYWSVEPVGGDWLAIMEWCHKTYGNHSDPRKEPGGRWYTESRKIWFREQKDRDWFVLRWNS